MRNDANKGTQNSHDQTLIIIILLQLFAHCKVKPWQAGAK